MTLAATEATASTATRLRKAACPHCHAAKVKCDKALPSCGRCVRLNLVCELHYGTVVCNQVCSLMILSLDHAFHCVEYLPEREISSTETAAPAGNDSPGSREQQGSIGSINLLDYLDLPLLDLDDLDKDAEFDMLLAISAAAQAAAQASSHVQIALPTSLVVVAIMTSLLLLVIGVAVEFVNECVS